MAPDRPPLEERLREALHAEARQRPLRTDFASSATAGLPDRSGAPSAGWLRMVLPSVAAVVVIAVVAAFAVINGLESTVLGDGGAIGLGLWHADRLACGSDSLGRCQPDAIARAVHQSHPRPRFAPGMRGL